MSVITPGTWQQHRRAAYSCGMDGARYPENQMEFAPEYGEPIPESWQHFFDLREQLLLDYGYNTARAYWADLQDLFEWAVARDKDVLALTDKDIRQYCALLRRREYSENTVRRRMVAWRLLSRAHPLPGERIAPSERRTDETTSM